MTGVKQCPIRVAMERTSIGKKWTLLLIRNILFGMDTFSDMMRTNPGLSSKVLNENLRQMMDEGLINRVEIKPRDVRYTLTPMGRDLNRVLFEISRFGAKHFPDEVFEDKPPVDPVGFFGKQFRIPDDEIEVMRKPVVSLR